MKCLILVLVFAALSCTHTKLMPQISPDDDLIFFDGTYKQKIEVTYVKDQKKEQAVFNAVLKKSPQEINMYCYVGFGYTLFKLKDNLKDPIQFVTSEERIEKNKDFFLKMYPLIKETLLLKRSDPRLKNGEMMMTMQPQDFPVKVVISDEKIQGVPVQVSFENKDHFRFVVKNTEYNP